LRRCGAVQLAGLLCVLAGLLVFADDAGGQDGLEAAGETELESAPTLDELLGLDLPAEWTDRAEREADSMDEVLQSVVDAALGDAPEEDLLAAAAARMRDAASAIASASAPASAASGERPSRLAATRLQREALRRLDRLIDSASQRAPRADEPPPSERGSDPEGQRPNDPAPRDASEQASGEPESSASGGGTPTEAGASLGEVVAPDGSAERGEAWGRLPVRLRGQLEQGLSERFGAEHRDATEAFYRRLAEEAASR